MSINPLRLIISGSFLFSHFFLVLVKKFYEGLKAWQRNVKIKNKLIIYLPTGLGWEGLSRESTLFNLSLNLLFIILNYTQWQELKSGLK